MTGSATAEAVELRRSRRFGPAIALVAVLLVVWELYARASGVSPFVLPPPSRVIAALWEFRDQAIGHAIPTILETLVGFALSIFAATAAAIALDRIPVARRGKAYRENDEGWTGQLEALRKYVAPTA